MQDTTVYMNQFNIQCVVLKILRLMVSNRNISPLVKTEQIF